MNKSTQIPRKTKKMYMESVLLKISKIMSLTVTKKKIEKRLKNKEYFKIR